MHHPSWLFIATAVVVTFTLVCLVIGLVISRITKALIEAVNSLDQWDGDC